MDTKDEISDLIDQTLMESHLASGRPFVRELLAGNFDSSSAHITDLVEAICTAGAICVDSKQLIEEFIWRTGEIESLHDEYFRDGKCIGSRELNAELEGHGYRGEMTDVKLCARFNYINPEQTCHEGNLRLLKWQHTHKYPIGSSAFRVAIRAGQIECAKYLLADVMDPTEIESLSYMPYELITDLIEGKSIDCLKLMLEEKLIPSGSVLDVSIGEDSLEFVKYLLRDTKYELLDLAINHNAINCARYLLEQGCTPQPECVQTAIEECGVPMIQLLLEYKCPMPADVLAYCFRERKPEIARLLITTGQECTQALQDHIPQYVEPTPYIQLLHDYKCVKPDALYIRYFSEKRRDAIMFLHSLGYPITDDVVIYVVTHCPKKSVSYLHECKIKFCTRHGKAAIDRHLVETFIRLHGLGMRLHKDLYNYAYKSQCQPIIQYIHKHLWPN